MTGPQALLPVEWLAILTDVLERDLHLVGESADHARRWMGESMPDTMVGAPFQFFRRSGYDDSFLNDTIVYPNGRPPRTFHEWAFTQAQAFR